jgi:hypothetical protein
VTDQPEPFPDKHHGYNADQMRALLIAGHWPSNMIREAAQWLGEWDARERARISASQAEQNRTARTAKTAAIVAAIAATISIPLVIIGIIVAVLGWLYPRTPPSHSTLPQQAAPAAARAAPPGARPQAKSR